MIPLNSILIKAFNWQTLRKNNASIIYVARVCPEYWNQILAMGSLSFSPIKARASLILRL